MINVVAKNSFLYNSAFSNKNSFKSLSSQSKGLIVRFSSSKINESCDNSSSVTNYAFFNNDLNVAVSFLTSSNLEEEFES